MSQSVKALVTGLLMIGIAVLAIADIIPQEIARFAPVALMAVFPLVFLRGRRNCSKAIGG